MKNSSKLGLIASFLVGMSAFAFSAEDNPLKISGTADIYYLRDLNSGTSPLNLRSFDSDTNRFKLNTALAKLRYTPAKSPISFSVDFGFGKMQDVTNATEPGGSKKYKNFQQAFVSYAKGSTNLDFGKFKTWMGYEDLENSENPNYGQGYIWTLGTPTYHFGARTAIKAKDMDVKLFLVRGWNEVEDSNTSLSFGGQVAKNLNSKTALTLNFIGGSEGSSTGGVAGVGYADAKQRGTYVYNAILNFKMSDTKTLVLEGLYANALGTNGSTSAQWSGVAGYAILQFSPKAQGTLRLEAFNDVDGVRTGTKQNLAAATVTGKYKMSPTGTVILEFRSEKSNNSVFTGRNGNRKDRNRLSAAYILKF